jgi:RNA:NAD 2'-phosphotransferase (TPT1/KptA family)
MDVSEEIAEWVGSSDADEVADWLDTSVAGPRLVSRCSALTQTQRYPSLFECLIEETHLSQRIAEIGPYLRAQGLRAESTIRKARERLANAAYYRAMNHGWSRPVVFVSTLDLARNYLRALVEMADHSGMDASGWRSRLGVATVLSARFSPPTFENLHRATAELLSAFQRGFEGAGSYYLEANVQHYDLDGGHEYLEDAARFIQEVERANSAQTGLTTAWRLNAAEVWIKLAGEATSGARARFLRLAEAEFDSTPSDLATRHEDVRRKMLVAYHRFLGSSEADALNVNSRGVGFPYGLRSRWSGMPPVFSTAARSLVESLDAGVLAGEYLHREISAELCSYLARESIDATEAARLLRRAIEMRGATQHQNALSYDRAILDQAIDQLELARITGDSAIRGVALKALSQAHSTNGTDAASLTVLSIEIDRNGPHIAPLLPGDSTVALAIRNGETEVLFGLAAARAFASQDTAHLPLGGRGSVEVVEDDRGITGQTFVFKRMAIATAERDALRTKRLSLDIRAAGLHGRFGVIEHIASIRDPQEPDGEQMLVSVRRFSTGQTLHEHLKIVDPESRASVFREVAVFLAFIHSQSDPRMAVGVRKTLWEVEVGRWLRAIVPEAARMGPFQDWWDVVGQAPVLPRRDAHALNWLVADDRILGVDFDCVGWRPLGYELAQLTDDDCALAPDDWDSRIAIMLAYHDALRQFGHSALPSIDTFEEYYAGGLVARAIRLLSQPLRDPISMQHGSALLAQIAERYNGRAIGMLASKLAEFWSERIGTATLQPSSQLSEASRRRISRAMAYHLRHDEFAAVNREGWMHVEELTSALRREGHRVTVEQVSLISGAMGEPRFERDGLEIRARYGHSTKVSIDYEAKKPPALLFHATPLDNLASIVEAQAGLRRGKRNWVHLSEDPLVALGAARRQRSPVVLLSIETEGVEGLVYAAYTTWLAPIIALRQLRVIPLYAVGRTLPIGASSASGR